MTTIPQALSSSNYRRGESAGTTLSSATDDWAAANSEDNLFFVTSYSDFDRLAHGPRGTQAKNPIYVYRFNPGDGSLVLLNIQGDASKLVNPAFSRHHPRLNVVYTCTEDIDNNGMVFAYLVGPNGELEQLGDAVDAGGTSTCYLTVDKACQNLLCVNYWDSTLSVIPLSTETGAMMGPIQNMYDPKGGHGVVATGRVHGGVNHSCNDESTIRMRQADPHSHALVLDPFLGTVAYVPDLGKDLIREFYYDAQAGKIVCELNVLPSGLCSGMPDGPRYFEFHPTLNIAYCVNELSSTIAVFEVDRGLLQELAQASARREDMTRFKGRSTLRLIQSIKTLPSAFPTTMNTCGRICVHKSGRFVVVSNRGHQSIAVFKVLHKGSRRGQLLAAGYHHTRGETPRHFQFDSSGQYMLVANQDTDSLAVFTFNLSSGEIKYTGNEYRVPSPNFVCCCPLYPDDYEHDDAAKSKQMVATTTSPSTAVDWGSMTSSAEDVGELSDSDQSATYRPIDSNKLSAAGRMRMRNKDHLVTELELARREIAELKKQLSSLTVE